jgi:hypothetical protein
MEEKDKKKPNFWLEDSNFIKKSNFSDHYYLESLGKHISNFLKNAPIPILTTYDPQFKKIYFSIGNEKKGFELNTNIAYYDYLTLVKRWLINYYPQYSIEYEIDVSLSDDEIYQKVKEGVNLNDALAITKKATKKEKGIIEKIQLVADEFIINVNEERYLRLSGTPQKPQTLSFFLKKVREIKNQNEKKTFIFENSLEIRKLNDNKKEILINYQGKQLFNFFVVNFLDLKNEKLKELEPFLYQWGQFKIKFESKSLLNDCLNYYNNQMLKC